MASPVSVDASSAARRMVRWISGSGPPFDRAILLKPGLMPPYPMPSRASFTQMSASWRALFWYTKGAR